ncbi:TPA: conjugal transfer protein TrbF [Legionella pneumophila]|uniref:conjugal transfer protein TrbF n=1 Tax=Legionella pneumophila TaxID=446 RepID=UPI001374E57E|nr:conjugal transfer protein TrbF [Legionella pneumophila]HAT9326906.1 conjugal transfer protein TrbF [Legionella pneumophila subsp. pneumophila]MCK1858718.1 conjugal transfer protein TrbF [Legionella pneumophila]HAT1811106.1 conjugal transfer protein TrbF [Legionella pneumophila]HAT2028493.1 conjugal transfer protein TrbF [Legionella pneumophila]HAT8308156.1 conjugal transfer protein TrbF [Legionella pneumophila]
MKKHITQNPYLNARRAWNVHTAGLMKSVQVWQLVGLSSLLITLAAVGGLITIGSQSKFIPLVFQQDAQGNTLSVTRADRVGDASLEDYRAAAAHFIENIRLVSLDVELQKKAVFQVYSYLNANDAALTKVQEFYSDKQQSNPFERAVHEMVSVDIRSVLQESEHTWQVDWLETVRHRDGTLKDKPRMMKAMITLYQEEEIHDASSESILKNPHLIYVRDFNWSYELNHGDTP